jgi:hypothetical protein
MNNCAIVPSTTFKKNIEDVDIYVVKTTKKSNFKIST